MSVQLGELVTALDGYLELDAIEDSSVNGLQVEGSGKSGGWRWRSTRRPRRSKRRGGRL